MIQENFIDTTKDHLEKSCKNNIPHQNTYVLIAGGTGGHIFPAVALGQALKKKGYSLIFITDYRGEKFLTPYTNLFEKIITLKTPKNGSFFKRLQYWLYFLIKDFLSQYQLLKIFYEKKRPKGIIAFGGQFTIIPFLIAKKYTQELGKKPTEKKFIYHFYLQQSDAVMGLANKILLPMADKIFTTFSLKCKDKEITIGLPIREEFYESAQNLEEEKKNIKNKFCILILGGSQGALFWTSLMIETFSLISPQERSKFFVYHQCPESQLSLLKQHYSSLGIDCHIQTFFYDLPKIMMESSLVLSRSGASTLGEICTLSKAAVLIPYGYAKNNHQEHNGQHLVQMGGAWMFCEKDITPEKIKDILLFGMYNPEILIKMGQKNHSLMAKKAVDIFLNYL